MFIENYKKMIYNAILILTVIKTDCYSSYNIGIICLYNSQ